MDAVAVDGRGAETIIRRLLVNLAGGLLAATCDALRVDALAIGIGDCFVAVRIVECPVTPVGFFSTTVSSTVAFVGVCCI